MQPAAVLSVLVKANTSQASTGLARFNSQLGATQGKANRALGAVKMMAKGAAIGAAGGIAYAVKKAADFEEQLDSLGSVSGATGKDMERFRKQAMKAGADTKFSALDAAQAQTELAKGGLSVRNIMRGGLKSALALAAAGEMDLGEAASTTANSMKLFGLRGKDSMKVADALATAANRTTADVSDFAMALKMGGSVAKMAGMSLNETVVILEALAEAGIKNSDAGTSMKAFFLNITRSSPKAREAMEELGLEIFNAQGQLKSLPAISKNMRQAFGDLTKEQFLNKAGTIAGSDAVRTLWALYDAGPQKLAGLERATAKQGTAAKVAAEKQDNLKGKLENLRGSVETAAIAIGTKWLPALTKAAKVVTDIINDPKLTAGEKFSRIAQMAADAFSAAIPKVADAAAKAAPVVLRAFLDGFRNSSLWGKLVIGTFLLAKMGGLGPFRSVGTKAGGAMGAGMASGAAATAGAQLPGKFAGLRSRMAGIGKNVLGAALVMGIADAATKEGISGFTARFAQGASTATFGILPAPRDIDERMRTIVSKIQAWRSSGKLALNRPGDPSNSIIKKEDLSDFTGRQRQMLGKMAELRNTANRLFGPGTKLIPNAWVNPGRATKDLRLIANEFGRMRSGAVLNMKDLRQVTANQFKLIARSMGVNSKEGRQAVQTNFGLGLRAVRGFMRDGTLSARGGMREIKNLMVTNSVTGRQSVFKNFKQVEAVISGSMTNSKGVTREGMQAIRLIMVNEMENLGLSQSDIRMSLNKKESARKGPVQPGQTGMVVSGGKPTGDSVHALLERGEVVVNRKAVQKMGGPEKVNQLNQMVPRFQAGGIIGLGRQLQRQGFDVGEHPAFGGVAPVHSQGSYHYRGMALDVNADMMPGGEAKNLDRLYSRLKNMPGVVELLWRVADHFNHLHVAMSGGGGRLGGLGAEAAKIARLTVDGPGGPLQDTVQRALDVGRSGAQRKLNEVAGSVEGAEKGISTAEVTGSGAGLMKQISAARGWNFPDWWELDRRESTHGTDLFNEGSGAALRGQFMPGITQGHYGPGSDPGQNPSMAQQIWSMARYIKDRYGNPTAARQFHDSHNWYAKGGTVGQPVGMQRGGARGRKGDKVALGKALKTIYKSKKPKVRSKALRGLLGRIDKIDLPPRLQSNLGSLEKNANVYGELASRAGQLTVEPVDSGGGWDGDGGGDGDGEGVGQAIPGVADGKTETEWLGMQLAELFKYRNAILKAEKIAGDRRERVAKLIAQAQKRLAAVTKKIQEEAKRKQRLEAEVKKHREQLAEWREHPVKNAARIAALRGKIMGKVSKIHGITKAQVPRVRLRTALKDKIIPGLTTKHKDLGQAREDMLLSLDEVQGPGSSMEVLGKLPALGSLGGQIFDVQMRLRALGEKPGTSKIKDFSTPEAAEVAEVDTTSADLLAQLLRESNLRTAVSERQFDVFKNMPPYGGQFAAGGVVPGPAGAPRMILAHGQETVTPAGGGDVNVSLHFAPGTEWLRNFVKVQVEGETRKQARAGGRVLPGGGGG